ncbi:MAG: adenylate/guanylate cyclase domain-containing protein [Actinomycetota bacterium]
MATRIPAAVIVVAFVSLAAAVIAAVVTGRDLGEDITEERLEALQATAAQEVIAELRALGNTAAVLGDDPTVAATIAELSAGLDELRSGDAGEVRDALDVVVGYHRETYLEPLRAAGREVRQRDVTSEDAAAVLLQLRYRAALDSGLDPTVVDDPGDGSAWTELHRELHPIASEIVQQFGLTDLLLVEPRAARVVYSYAKGPDLGTSLFVGPFSGSAVASSVARVLDEPGEGVVYGDQSTYVPTLFEPVGAIAAPVLDGDEVGGVLVFLHPARRLTEILTADQSWDDAGFSETGESYLIGADGALRSDPREYLEAPAAFLDTAVETGSISEASLPLIEASRTVVPAAAADAGTVAAARSEPAVVAERRTLTGRAVASTVLPLEFGGLDWSVVSEVDAEVATGDLDDFEGLLIVGTSIFVVVLAFVAVAWADRTVRPIRLVSDRLDRSARDDLELPSSAPLEFHRLGESVDDINQRRAGLASELADVVAARHRTLRRLVPDAVALRIAADGDRTIERVPQITVGVVVVRGLGVDVQVNQLDELYDELDAIASEFGLQRIQIAGDAYLVACGQERPVLDHAPRTLAFARSARATVEEMLPEAAVAIGVATGPVNVTMSGSGPVLHDLWGPALVVAHRLVRRAEDGEVLISESTTVLVSDDVEVRARPDAVLGEVNALGPSPAEVRR